MLIVLNAFKNVKKQSVYQSCREILWDNGAKYNEST